MSRTYKIKTIKSIDEVENGELALVDIYNWGGEYRPVTKAWLCFIKGQGFAVKMECEERNPLVTVIPPVGFVSVDSCMEFFANFFPTNPTDNADEKPSPYINLEVNAVGAMCCEFGPTWGIRPRFTDNNIKLPQVKPFIKENSWGFEMYISLELIHSVYNRSDFEVGSIIKGSFYKCGDKTEMPHYASFTEIDMPFPSFHQPKSFADMIIVD